MTEGFIARTLGLSFLPQDVQDTAIMLRTMPRKLLDHCGSEHDEPFSSHASSHAQELKDTSHAGHRLPEALQPALKVQGKETGACQAEDAEDEDAGAHPDAGTHPDAETGPYVGDTDVDPGAEADTEQQPTPKLKSALSKRNMRSPSTRNLRVSIVNDMFASPPPTHGGPRRSSSRGRDSARSSIASGGGSSFRSRNSSSTTRQSSGSLTFDLPDHSPSRGYYSASTPNAYASRSRASSGASSACSSPSPGRYAAARHSPSPEPTGSRDPTVKNALKLIRRASLHRRAPPQPTKAIVQELLEAASHLSEWHTINAHHLPNHVLLQRLSDKLAGHTDRSSVAAEAAQAAAALARGEVPTRMLITLTDMLASLKGLLTEEVGAARADQNFRSALRETE